MKNPDYVEKPVIGVMPKWRWDELYPEPTVMDYLNRGKDIHAYWGRLLDRDIPELPDILKDELYMIRTTLENTKPHR